MKAGPEGSTLRVLMKSDNEMKEHVNRSGPGPGYKANSIRSYLVRKTTIRSRSRRNATAFRNPVKLKWHPQNISDVSLLLRKVFVLALGFIGRMSFKVSSNTPPDHFLARESQVSPSGPNLFKPNEGTGPADKTKDQQSESKHSQHSS